MRKRGIVARSLVLTALTTAMGPTVVWAQTAPMPFTNATRYDAAGRITGKIASDPDASGPLRYAAVRNSYDLAGRLAKVEKGELATWPAMTPPKDWERSGLGFAIASTLDIFYDGMGRKTRETTSSNGVLMMVKQYSFDGQGRPECTAMRMNPAAFASPPASACALGPEGADGPDRITRNEYDAAGQLIRVQRAYATPLQQDYARYEYTANGKRKSVTDANGNRAELRYDSFDRQDRWTFPSKTTAGQVNPADYEEYGYDTNGNRTSLRKRDGRIITFAYDALNRMTSKVVADGCAPIQVGACPSASATRDVYYGYDLRGLQTYARFNSASGEGINTVYDGFGQVVSSTNTMGGASRALSFTYDADGNRTRITHPDGRYFDNTYDGLDRELSLFDQTGGQLNLRTYDKSGRLSGNFGGGQAYGYDGVGRLTSLNIAFGQSYDVASSFSYNPASQMSSRTRSNDAYAFSGYVNVDRNYAVNGLNQYTSAGLATFTYDANGNLVSDGTTSYVYDAENRLVQASNGAGLVYDPLGRLAESSGGAAGITRFLYEGDQLVFEYNAAGTVVRRHVHGAGEDDPAIWYEGAGISAGERRYTLADHQGSIMLSFDGNLTQVGINAYDEYGITTNTANGALAPVGRFGYTGQAWLPELGMYYYKARMYSPTLGRFMQTDPIGYDDQINLYAYVANDPVNRTDPTGMQDRFDMQMRQDDEALLNGSMSEEDYRDRQTARGVGGLAGAGVVATALTGGRLLPAIPAVAKAIVGKIFGVAEKVAPEIKAGSAGGETAGKVFPQAVKDAARAENPTATCVYCRRPGTGTQVDHTIPRARSGNATPENAQLACPHCNASKGAGEFPKSPPPGYRGKWPPNHW